MADREAEDSTAPKAARAMPIRDPRLRYNAEILHRLQETPSPPNTRAAALHVLEAVRDMLRNEIPQLDGLGLLAPLDHLHAALRNLDVGGHPAMLQPDKQSGRAPADPMMIELKARVVVTVDRLCDLDDLAVSLTKRRQRACEEIASVLAECGVQPQRAGAKDQRGIGLVTARTVRGWFDEVAQSAKNSPLVRAYNSLLEPNHLSLVERREIMLAAFGHALPAPELAARWRRALLSCLRSWIEVFST